MTASARAHPCPPDRNCTVSAAMLHDAAAGAPLPGRRIWSQPGNRATGVGQATPEAITLATRPPQKPGGTATVPSPPGRQAARP